MQRRLTLLLLLAGLALSGTGNPARAVLLVAGPAQEGNSWSQNFNESGVGSFDFLRVDWISSTNNEYFSAPGLTHGVWTHAWGTDYFVGGNSVASAITGAASTNLTFTLHFTGVVSDDISFYFTAYHQGVWKDGARVVHTRNGAISNAEIAGITQAEWDPGTARPNAVPEPSSAVAVALGLLTLAGLRRKFRS